MLWTIGHRIRKVRLRMRGIYKNSARHSEIRGSADEQDAFAVAHGHGISMGGSKHRTKIATEERNQASNDLGALGTKFCCSMFFYSIFCFLFLTIYICIYIFTCFYD